MFRIKTDIRQFNCETQEKVEKLIRSWVIRPTDLMLDEARQTWSPIGQREEFASIFEDIKDLSDVEDMSAEEANTPESQGGADDMLQQDLDEMEQELIEEGIDIADTIRYMRVSCQDFESDMSSGITSSGGICPYMRRTKPNKEVTVYEIDYRGGDEFGCKRRGTSDGFCRP